MSLTHSQALEFGLESGPFNLDDEAAYSRWRAHKLRNIPANEEQQRVPITRLHRLRAAATGCWTRRIESSHQANTTQVVARYLTPFSSFTPR